MPAKRWGLGRTGFALWCAATCAAALAFAAWADSGLATLFAQARPDPNTPLTIADRVGLGMMRISAAILVGTALALVPGIFTTWLRMARMGLRWWWRLAALPPLLLAMAWILIRIQGVSINAPHPALVPIALLGFALLAALAAWPAKNTPNKP